MHVRKGWEWEWKEFNIYRFLNEESFVFMDFLLPKKLAFSVHFFSSISDPMITTLKCINMIYFQCFLQKRTLFLPVFVDLSPE